MLYRRERIFDFLSIILIGFMELDEVKNVYNL